MFKNGDQGRRRMDTGIKRRGVVMEVLVEPTSVAAGFVTAAVIMWILMGLGKRRR